MATATESLVGTFVPMPFTVAARHQDTVDTWTLTLEPLHQGLTVEPGQFMMVYAFGIGEVPISVSGLPRRAGDSIVLTVRAVGAVTSAICGAPTGSVLGLRGPFGNSWPIDAALGRDIVVVAGGIGLAPLRPVVRATVEHRAGYGAVSLLYGARTPDDLLYPHELPAWRRDISVEITVDAADAGWRGRVGVVPKLVAQAAFDPDDVTAFVCGPEIMMRFTVEALHDRGVPDERIFLSFERDMRCGVGLCGHCQLGPTLICRDGPVYSQAQIGLLAEVREL